MLIWKSVGRDIKDMMGSGSSVHTGRGENKRKNSGHSPF